MFICVVVVLFASFLSSYAEESFIIDHYGPKNPTAAKNNHNETICGKDLSHRVYMTDGDGEVYLVDLLLQVNESLIDFDIGKRNEYWLFTRKNNVTAQILVNGDIESVKKSNYQVDKPVYVLLHGWRGTGSSSGMPLITSAILAAEDANVIVVDWRHGADNLYVLSIIYVPFVGKAVGEFLTWLVDATKGDWNKVYLAGLSLGAHVVGNAGRQANSQPARVVGLDPAGPLWTYNDHALRSTDGQYVEAIHTNGYFLGIFVPIAGANFYPNGGSRQPGCVSLFCPHIRAAELFAASVQFNHLDGKQCKDLTAASDGTCNGKVFKLGNGDVNKRGSGIYYLKTKGEWPFDMDKK